MSKNQVSANCVSHRSAIKSTEHWLTSVVIELNLCPFAQREYINKRIRFECSDAGNEEELLAALLFELQALSRSSDFETSLLIHPYVLHDFADYNQFLSLAESLIDSMGLSGDIQIASFHPQYQFADTAAEDAENYTNRSPYPMIHLLREESVERVVAQHPNTAQIPHDNIAMMHKLGAVTMAQRLSACYVDK